MRCTINRMALVQALNKLEPAIPLKSMYLQEIFYHVLVQAHASGITLTATNGDVRVSIHVVTSMLVIEDGFCAVNYAQLVESLKAFPRKAELIIRLDEHELVLSMGPLSKAIKARAASEFPASCAIPAVGESYETEERDGTFGREYPGQMQTSKYTYQILRVDTQRLLMQRAALLAAVEKVACAAATDDSRPVLMAVYTQLQDDELTLVAGDGFRLAEHRTRVAGAGTWKHGALIWGRYFLCGLRLMAEEWESQVSVEVHMITQQLVKRNGYPVTDQEPTVECVLIRLVGDHEEVDLRPIKGSYPNYQHVIPRQAPTMVTCETAALLAALEEVAPIAKGVSNKTDWYVEGTMLRVEVKSAPEPIQPPEPVPPLAVKLVPMKMTGEEKRISLNCALVLTIIRAIPTQRLVLGLIGLEKPAVFWPDGDEQQTIYVCMPMSWDR